MKNNVRMLAVVVAVSGFTVACGGGTDSSLLGPSATTTSAASTGSGGGNGGANNGGATTTSTGNLTVQCEQRSGRSKVSVDARNVARGTYQARITSGANSATAAAQASVADEVEFDFDSDRGDIAAGATAIAASFIQNGSVHGELLDGAGTVVATATASCAVR